MWDLSSPTRMEPAPPALEAWSLNHWTAREVQLLIYLIGRTICQLREMTKENGKSFIDPCNLQPDLGRCLKFINYPPHLRKPSRDAGWSLGGGRSASRRNPWCPMQPAASVALPTADPNWDVSAGDG